MSRYVCGSHELKSNASIVPPKNWEARSWSGDGRRPSGALHQLGSAHSIELVAPLLLFFIESVCGSLGLGGAALARSGCRESRESERSPGRALDRTRIRVLKGAPPGQLDPQLDRVEFPLFGLDRVRWSSWSVWPWNSSSFSACCLPFPWLERRGSVRLLGREPPWVVRSDLLLGKVGLGLPSSSCLKNQKPSSPNS
ncbi:unnamed protein product [Microthlaspi erraticum]|uniref:Uncharacterized protein n=1 Tax=Microthlaspi erraticum TaxID=1685480 RepID=A0A6D2KL93_9BRAS|nr:unnamed protein product [Microthlaspi erraticum]